MFSLDTHAYIQDTTRQRATIKLSPREHVPDIDAFSEEDSNRLMIRVRHALEVIGYYNADKIAHENADVDVFKALAKLVEWMGAEEYTNPAVHFRGAELRRNWLFLIEQQRKRGEVL